MIGIGYKGRQKRNNNNNNNNNRFPKAMARTLPQLFPDLGSGGGGGKAALLALASASMGWLLGSARSA